MNSKILPVYSHASYEQCAKVLKACYASGIRKFEFTNRSDNALDVFEKLMQLCKSEMPDMQLGAGTIMNSVDARQFMAKGAAFLVSPLISQDLIDFTTQHQIDWLPGCATGAEVGMAYNAGISFVKLFPIKTLGGADFIKLMKGPYAMMQFQVSGGIKGEIAEVKALLDAGASVVGLGNSFFEESLSSEEITAKLKQLMTGLA